MGKGKEAADDDEDAKDRNYRPARALPPDTDNGSSASLPVRSSARLREAANHEATYRAVLDEADVPGLIAYYLHVRIFGENEDQCSPRRPMFMHDSFTTIHTDQSNLRFPNVRTSRRFHGAMRLGMVNRIWRRRIFGLGINHIRTLWSPYDANGLYPVAYIVESSRRMLQAITANDNLFDPLHNDRACVLYSPNHFDLTSNDPLAGFDLMRMASRDMYHLHNSIDDTLQELAGRIEQIIGEGPEYNLFWHRLSALIERRWLNMRFILAVIYLMAFVCQGLHLRPADDQRNLIGTIQDVMRRFQRMAHNNRDYVYMYREVYSRFSTHLAVLIRQVRPYSRRDPYRLLDQMLRDIPIAREPHLRLAMATWDSQPVGTNPFYMMNLAEDIPAYAGPGTQNMYHTMRRNIGTLAEQTPSRSGAPMVYVTGQPILHQMVPGQQPRGFLPENREWTVTRDQHTWHTSVQVAFAWALRRAMADRGVVPNRMWVSNVSHHAGEGIWDVFVRTWRQNPAPLLQTSSSDPVVIDEDEAQDST